jgi:hypothetical protein
VAVRQPCRDFRVMLNDRDDVETPAAANTPFTALVRQATTREP